MSDDNNYELSRRKALIGLGTIGAAGAAAGFGTSALFTDQEDYNNNSITAGTLDMVVDAEVVATVDNPYWNNQIQLEGKGQEADGAAVEAAIDIEDAKPGDWLIICFTITNEENPGYVRISSSNFEESEGGPITDPEDDVDNTPSDGELDEKLLATAWNEFDDTTPGDDRSDLTGLQYPTNAVNGDKDTHTWDSSRNEDGVVTSGSIEYTSVREAHNNFSNGVVVSDSSGDPKPVGTFANVDGPASEEDAAVFYLLLEIPKSVGNEIQSDSVELDLNFESEQVRNNDNPFN